MTDKQIIIDGCDVSGCPNFTFNEIEPNESICISEQSAMCINNKDCLYKKWKRKEQECEELVSKCNQLDKKCKQQSWDIGNLGYKIKNQRHEINNRLKQLNQLKAENEKLRQYKASKQASYEEMQKRWNEVELENRKLKASLGEKNEFLEKLGISAAGEFKRIKHQIDKLVVENKELKAKSDQLTILGMDLKQNNEILRKSFFIADKNKDDWREKAEIYCKTLTEIKKIVGIGLVDGLQPERI